MEPREIDWCQEKVVRQASGGELLKLLGRLRFRRRRRQPTPEASRRPLSARSHAREHNAYMRTSLRALQRSPKLDPCFPPGSAVQGCRGL